MAKIKVVIENDFGIERTLELPGKYEICPRCAGEGKIVNPNVDGHGISPEEFAEDPDFKEAYFSGVYDIACTECNGQRVVPELDRDYLRSSKAKSLLLARIEDKERAIAECDRESYLERMMGA